MNLDAAGAAHHRVRQRATENAAQRSRARLAEHDLSNVLARGELQDRGRIVAPLEAHRLAAQALGEGKHLGQPVGALGVAGLADRLDRDGGPVALRPVASWLARRTTRSETSSAPDAGEQALGRRPRTFDRLLAQIVDHLVVDAIGRAAQRQFAQRGQIAGGEEVLGRPPGRLRHIDLAFVQALNELVGREVDQHDVGGLLQDRVGHGLAHGDAGDAGDDVGEAFEMLDVERGPDVDAGGAAAPGHPASASGCRLSGALVWASSSTTISLGLRASAASRSNSSIVRP